MANNDIKIRINTAVEGQKELTEYQKELLKLGQSSEEVNKQLEKLAETMGDLVQAQEIKMKLAETSEALDSTTDALETASKALVRSREEFLNFSGSANPDQLREMNKHITDQEEVLRKLQVAQESARREYSDTNEVVGKASDNVKRLITDNDHYNASIESAKANQSALNLEMGKLKEVGEAYNQLGVKDLEKEIESLENAYKTLKHSGTLSATELKDAHQKLTDEVGKYKKTLDGTDQASKDFKKSSQQFLPIVTSLAKITQAAIDYEEAMVGIKQVTTATDEQFQRLSESLLQMSKTTPISAKGLVEMAAAGAQLGVEFENLGGFVKITADMASAFGMTTEDAGKAVVNLSNIFGITLDETEKLGDAIVYLSNNSGVEAKKIVDVLVEVGDAGEAVGLTAQEIAAFGTTMLSFGESSDIAGASINAMLTRLQMLNTLGPEGKSALDKMGISAATMSQKFSEDAAGALVYFLEQVDKLQDDEKAKALTQIFDQMPQAGILLMADNVGKLKTQLDLAGNSFNYLGSVQDKANKQSDTTTHQMQLLKNNIDVLAINLGSMLLPIINKTVGGLTDIVGAVAKFTEQFPEITKYAILLATAIASTRLLSASIKLMGTNIISAMAPIKALGAFVLANTKTMVGASIATKGLTVAMASLGIAVGAISGGMIALNKWMEAFEERANANRAVLEAEEKVKAILEERTKKLAQAKQKEAETMDLLSKANMHNTLTAKEQVAALETVDAILAKTGISAQELQTNISNSSRTVVDDFNEIANSGIATSKVLSYQLAEALKIVKTPEEMNLLISNFNTLAEQGKISASIVVLFKDELNKLSESFQNGTLSEAEFTEKKQELVKVIAEQKNGLAQVNAEIATQIDLINLQTQQDKQVTDSLIKKLEAQREYAKLMGDSVKVQQLSEQIEATRVAGMKREASAIKENTALLKQELNALQQRQQTGEKLTIQEQERIRALQVQITAQENEAETLAIASQTREKATQVNQANTASIKALTAVTSGLADANQHVAESAGNINEQVAQIANVKTTAPALRGLADEAKMSQKAVDDLRFSINELTRERLMGGAGNAYQRYDSTLNQIADEINRAEELEKIIGNTENATLSQIQSWENMVRGFNYVNDESIENLRKNLEQMKKEVEKQHEEIKSKNDDLRSQLMNMRMQDDNFARQRQQADELAKIRKEIEEADKEGDKEKSMRLQEQLSLVIQIQNEQNRQARITQEKEAKTQVTRHEETVEIKLNGATLENVDPQNPEYINRVSRSVVDAIIRSRDSSTKYQTNKSKARVA